MVVQHDGGGSGFPPLPADAGPTERALYEIYDFQSGIVSYTASQWKTTADEITDLASSVRQVVRELRRAPDGGEAWSGTAAEAAYDSLGKLATNLDRHAEDILNIEAGLTAASDAVGDARTAYVTRVRTVDTDIDQTGYMTGPPPPPVGPPVPKTLDTAAYDQAVSAARAQRESEAQLVMQTYDTRMETAAKKLPVEPAESPVSDGSYPSGPGTPGGYPGGNSGGGGGGYTPPKPTRDDLPPTDDDNDGDDDENPTIWEPPTGNPDIEICSGLPEVSVDAPTETGGLTPGNGVPTPSTGTTTPSGVPSGGIGGAGAAMGMGGMVAGGGAAALFGRGGGAGRGLGSGRPGGVGASGRPGVVGVGSTGGAASRGNGGTAGRGGTGAGGTGRSSVVAGGGGQGAAGRGTGGRGGAGGRGAGRTGRYGVPQLGEKGGRGGAAGAAGTAGSRGGRRKDERDGQDVDHLTHEDEETWFEGSDDASPPVWD